MKVIIIKNCKDGKVNDVIEVKDGYGKNFLINNKLALPYSKSNAQRLSQNLARQKAQSAELRQKFFKIKEKLEALELVFKVKIQNDVIHSSVTRKQIHKRLEKLGVKLDIRLIENAKINSLGKSFVLVTLLKDIKAKLKVEVKSEK